MGYRVSGEGDEEGEELEAEKRRASALSPVTSRIPSMSKVPQATALPSDPSLVMHRWTYAICI